MRWLEVRRHSMTKKGTGRGRGSHLCGPGVALARQVGASLGPFATVLTSASPRAVETAVAMGFAVDDTAELPSAYVPGEFGRHEQWAWSEPYRRLADLVHNGRGVAAVAESHADLWRRAVTAVPDGGAALVVSHGGGMELALVLLRPDADLTSWGRPFGHCDGVRLGYDGGAFVAEQFIRVRTAAAAVAER